MITYGIFTVWSLCNAFDDHKGILGPWRRRPMCGTFSWQCWCQERWRKKQAVTRSQQQYSPSCSLLHTLELDWGKKAVAAISQSNKAQPEGETIPAKSQEHPQFWGAPLKWLVRYCRFCGPISWLKVNAFAYGSVGSKYDAQTINRLEKAWWRILNNSTKPGMLDRSKSDKKSAQNKGESEIVAKVALGSGNLKTNKGIFHVAQGFQNLQWSQHCSFVAAFFFLALSGAAILDWTRFYMIQGGSPKRTRKRGCKLHPTVPLWVPFIPQLLGAVAHSLGIKLV